MRNKKKILFMHHASSIGGGSYCLLNIIKGIDRSEIDVTVMLRTEGPLTYELEAEGVNVVYFPEMIDIPYNKSLLIPSSINAYRKLAKSLDVFKRQLLNLKPEILYINNTMLCGYLKSARELNIKTIIHIREHWPLGEHTFQLNWVRNCVNKYADEMVAINKYSASMFPRKQSTIIYDWVDMEKRYEPYPLEEIFGEDMTNKHVFVYTGGFSSIKGVKEVLQAFIETRTGSNDRLLILGKPYTVKDSFKTRIKKVLDKLGIRELYEKKVLSLLYSDKRIKCIPPIYNISHILQQAYCNISYFTIPHANLAQVESILMGTPSIAARTEESVEYSIDEKLSSLFKLCDYNDFKLSLQKYDSEYENLCSEICKSKNVISAQFSREQNVMKLNNLIKSLIS